VQFPSILRHNLGGRCTAFTGRACARGSESANGLLVGLVDGLPVLLFVFRYLRIGGEMLRGWRCLSRMFATVLLQTVGRDQRAGLRIWPRPSNYRIYSAEGVPELDVSCIREACAALIETTGRLRQHTRVVTEAPRRYRAAHGGEAPWLGDIERTIAATRSGAEWCTICPTSGMIWS
jgi:hypothetical protein